MSEREEMSSKPESSTSSRPPEIPDDHWKINLYDPGDDDDFVRSCFIPCGMFGRTRHRLNLMEQGHDPLELTGYKDFNPTCWNYAGLCIGGLYIGSGVYTGRETTRIRDKYGIKGTPGDDITKGIFCQPCSLVRNDLEIRQREGMKREDDLPPPRPLGENYQPIYAMKPDGYKSEPRMTTPRGILKPITSPENSSSPDGQPHIREVHFYEPGQGTAPNVDALYPTEVGYVSQSPISPRTDAGPSNAIQHRSREGTLTPIQEADNQAAEERKKRTILGPAMNTFQRTTSPPVIHVTTSNAPIHSPIPTRDHGRSGKHQSPEVDRLEAPVQSKEPTPDESMSNSEQSPESRVDRLETPRSNVPRSSSDSPPTSQGSLDIRLSEDTTGIDEALAGFPKLERVPSPDLSRKAPNIGKPRTPVRKSRFSEEFDHPSADMMFDNIPPAAPSSSLDAPPRLPHFPGPFDTPAMPPVITVPAGTSNTQLLQLPGAFPSSAPSETPTRKPSALDQPASLRDVANQPPKVVTVEEEETRITEKIRERVEEGPVGDRPPDISHDPQLETVPPRDIPHRLSVDEQLA